MKLANIFTSNMVLPANTPINIFGTGKGHGRISLNGFKKDFISYSENFCITLPQLEYGGPYTLEFIHDNTTTLLDNVFIGKVFLLAGQSNIEFKMKEECTPKTEYKSIDKLRLFHATKFHTGAIDKSQLNFHFDANDGWVTCKKEEVEFWSAIGYHIGEYITMHENITVGIIACYQGASVIESWVPENTYQKIGINIPLKEKYIDHTFSDYSAWNGEGVLYNKVLSQIIPFSLSAVIWYQGESNTSIKEGYVYKQELCELIRIWRKEFISPNLPFYIVQLANFNERQDKGWKLVQQAQFDIQHEEKNVYTIISSDVCESNTIHPTNKKELSFRIAKKL